RRAKGSGWQPIRAGCAVSKSLILQDRQGVLKSSYPNRASIPTVFSLLWIAKPRKPRFLPQAPLGWGIARDVDWTTSLGSHFCHADPGPSASVCLGGGGGFPLVGDHPPLSRGRPRRASVAGTEARAGPRARRFPGLPPLGASP